MAAGVAGGRTADAAFVFTPAGGAPISITGFQENTGNALASNSTAAIAAGPGSTFQLYFQATLSNINPSNGNQPIPLTGGTYTAIGSITETVGQVVNAAGQTTVQFGVAPVQAAQSGLSLYFNPVVNAASPAAGTGFVGPQLLLQATPIASVPGNQNTFTQTNGATQAFNTTGGGGVPGTTTAIVGGGGYLVNFATIASSVNPAFFPGGAPSVISLTLNGSTKSQFDNVNPSIAFTVPIIGDGLFATQVPILGVTNGLGRDLQLQTTGDLTAVPEPTSLCLTGIGLGGLLVFARKRNTLSA